MIPVVGGPGRIGADLDRHHKTRGRRLAVAAGATLVNDARVSPRQVAAETGAAWSRCTARARRQTCSSIRDMTTSSPRWPPPSTERARLAKAAGVGEVWVDPGIGFGKTAHHNLQLLAALPRLVESATPSLWDEQEDVSRPDRCRELETAGRPGGRAFEGSLASAAWAMARALRRARP